MKSCTLNSNKFYLAIKINDFFYLYQSCVVRANAFRSLNNIHLFEREAECGWVVRANKKFTLTPARRVILHFGNDEVRRSNEPFWVKRGHARVQRGQWNLQGLERSGACDAQLGWQGARIDIRSDSDVHRRKWGAHGMRSEALKE